MRYEYNFDRTVNGINFNINDASEEAKLIWEVPSKEYINLWHNEMCGQISDGAWENSWGTDWLWKNNILFVESKIGNCKLWLNWGVWPKRKSFSIRSFLKYDWFLERLPEETGVATFAEAKAIWNKMNDAIKNSSHINGARSELQELVKVLDKERIENKQNKTERVMKKLYSNPRVKKCNYKIVYLLGEEDGVGDVKGIEIEVARTVIDGYDDPENRCIIKLGGLDMRFKIDDLDKAVEHYVALKRMVDVKYVNGFTSYID